MGLSSNRGSNLGPIPPILMILILGIFFKQVYGECLVDDCWDRYNNAVKGISDGYMSVSSQAQMNCIALRTYLICIKNISRSCIGEIKFHSVKKVVESRMKQGNCTVAGQTYPDDVDTSRLPNNAHNQICSYKGSRVHKHCGLFGDPHLRTFDDSFFTCRTKGAWPLIDNKYLIVQISNDAVSKDGLATATSKLTVIIKHHAECGSDSFVTYQAQTGSLPSLFDNGRSHFGPEKAVRILDKEPGKHIEIYIRYINTTLVIRHVGRYFTFAVQMPSDIVAESRNIPYNIQLCLKGCPLHEQVNFKEFLAHKKGRLKEINRRRILMSHEEAESQCKKANVVDFYYDSCVFDLMTTGDTHFIQAAHNALVDVLRLVPKDGQNNTGYHGYETLLRTNSAPSMSVISNGAFLWFLMLFIVTNHVL